MNLGGIFWGLALLPWTLSTLFHLPVLIVSLRSQWQSTLWLLAGSIFYFTFEIIFARPMRTYVFGHELTHALASIAMGGKVHAFRVSKKSGSVKVSKSNFIVALAPYFVPLYAAIALVAYQIAVRYRPFPNMHPAFQFMIGLTLAFHASLTFYAIRQRQPDLRQTGSFFSLVFILFMNAWVLAIISKILFWKSIRLETFFSLTWRTQWEIWGWALQHLWQGAIWFWNRAASGGKISPSTS